MKMMSKMTGETLTNLRKKIGSFAADEWQTYMKLSVSRRKTHLIHEFADQLGHGRDWYHKVFIQGAKPGNTLPGGIVRLFDSAVDEEEISKGKYYFVSYLIP